MDTPDSKPGSSVLNNVDENDLQEDYLWPECDCDDRSLSELSDESTSPYPIEDDLYSTDNSEYDLELYLHPFNGLDLGRAGRPNVPLPSYPFNALEEITCEICFESRKLRRRVCCKFPVCDECMEMYFITQINQGIVKIECLECKSYVHRDEILARLPVDMKEKFYKFLVDANKDSNVKTCPRCCHIVKLTGEDEVLNRNSKKKKMSKENRKKIKEGIKVECPKCDLEWCFPCQAPWHTGVTCKQYRKGDKLVRTWANEFHYGQQNAQKCPKCKIFIERTTGCDHMTCSHCWTNFCYRCGDRYWGMKLLGDHFSRFSPFGCKYNLMPDRPGARRFVRGAALGGKLLGGVLLAGVALAAGVALLGLSVIALPAIGGYRYRKRRKRRKILQNYSCTNKLDRLNWALKNEYVPPLVVIDEEEEAMREEWISLGISRCLDAREVEVIVHAGSDEVTHVAELPGTEEKDKVIVVTNVKEVKETGPYTRVVAHIVCKLATDVGEDNYSTDSSRGESSFDADDLNVNLDAVDVTLALQPKNEELAELSVKESNGCFANIFSKKLNPLQSVHDVQQGKLSVKRRSATLEKSLKSCTTGIDIKSLSSLMSRSAKLDDPVKQETPPTDASSCLQSCDIVTYL